MSRLIVVAVVAAGVALAGATGTAWWLGKQLVAAQEKVGALRSDLSACRAEEARLVGVTHDWKRAYDSKVKDLTTEAAQAYAEARERAKAICNAQFDAGYRYGKAISDINPRGPSDGLRDDTDDLRSQWIGATGQ